MPPESMNGASGTVQKSIYKDKLKSKSSKIRSRFSNWFYSLRNILNVIFFNRS